MYRISQLMSTPVASQCSSGSDRKYAGELSPTCIFPSFACDFLDGDSSFDCCSTDPLTGSYLPCRRSPRLLTNGYYIWTEDSFLCDRDGHITLSPSQTSVMYKENSVRIFRKKKRIRRSFSSLFDLRASKSWLHGSIFGDVDSSPAEDIWLEGVSRLDMHHGNGNGGDGDGSPTDDWEWEKPGAEPVDASSSGPVAPETPRKGSHGSSLQSQLTASDHLQGDVLDHSKPSLLGEISFQTVLLAACLILSACARWFLGGMLASAITCSCIVTVAYVVKLLFLSLASFFRATPCTRRMSPVLSSFRQR
ncbi:transmembrane protein 71 isoform X1 [Phyllostomus discolor]|uniref:Transmembrane protein 71 isoform X1 n=1 Tax=Phyllostomus discolor TaxID=89673 RepID=A0A7E6E8P5_9CHIR|nr:transmembrane protein 71 isoform X1 [Phyllostomus discolor]XP_035887327.1 transmembrane protein 71 isoform X1 [Phyllostomus discolor]XP_035887328.1 transmembrane protein 71 isoform X1 [Phyllostomus discolor]XP_035887329.1 transmembrane protein 71 isoform X1 [Phyllostomus discolor]